MSANRPDNPTEELAQRLTAQAKSLWGERRAAELQDQIDQTARLLDQLDQNLPDKNTEPGFYPQ